MMRVPLAIVLSGALISSGMSPAAFAAAAPAPQPAQVSAPQTGASTGNQPPLPPGRAVDLREMQGGADDDIGIGVIVLSWVAAGALLFLIFSGDDDDDSSPTGTF
jgi:hypothetical protein